VRETERDVRETTYNSDCICNSELSCFVLLWKKISQLCEVFS
jgi:hypothetical protein